MQNLENQRRHSAAAAPPPQSAAALTPLRPDLHQAMAEAIAHHAAGRAEQAEKLYRSILACHPRHASASYNLGVLWQTSGRLQEAADAYRDAIAILPGYVDAYVNLGTIALTQGQPDAAVEQFRSAIAIDPGCAMAYGNLGKALQDLGLIDEAVTAYREAISRQPDNAVATANLGGALLEQRAWDESAVVTRRAIALNPENAMAHANLGTVLLKLRRYDEASAACRQAMALGPRSGMIQATLGGAMLELGALAEAEALCRDAISLDASLPNAHFNLSHVLKETNQLPEATVFARQTLALRPTSAEYHFHLAHLLLLQGDLPAGWAEYEWRWKLPDFGWRDVVHGEFSQPQWVGQDISDKTILIYTEQGLGDIIQFSRYLPLLVGKAKRVVVAAHPPMRRLLETIEGITVVSIQDLPWPAFDVHCPLLSLPRAFATEVETIPAVVPYLHPGRDEQAAWKQRTGVGTLRVGIVWAGNPMTKRDRFRSPGLRAVTPLFSVPGVDFIVLQVGAGRDELGAEPLPSHVRDLGAEVSDLADTAAIIAGLDLVISSCTGPLHLAGALGVPTWAMIPFAPYFPWMLDRIDSPWYPTMRLYRQEQPGQDWSGVVGRITGDLAVLASTKGGQPPSPPAAPRQPSTAAVVDMPMLNTVNNFTVLESIYGKFVVNRHCAYQADALVKTGRTHIEAELATILTIVRSLDAGCVVVDAGANIGLVGIPIAREIKARGGVVHAFEVQRMLFYALCGSAALNDLDNLVVHNKAVGSAAGTISAGQPNYATPQDFGLYSLTTPIVDAPREDVAVVAIDQMGLSRLDFLKIDVEGMEPEVLRGARNAIRDFLPWCWVEYWKVDINEIKAHFPADAYRFYLMDHLNLLCVPIGRMATSGIGITGSSV